MTEWEARRALSDALLEYDPDNYNPKELLLVRKHCEHVYLNFVSRDRSPIRMEAVKADCLHALCNFEKFYRWSMTATEAERLMNELCYIRLLLDV